MGEIRAHDGERRDLMVDVREKGARANRVQRVSCALSGVTCTW